MKVRWKFLQSARNNGNSAKKKFVEIFKDKWNLQYNVEK